MWKVFWEVIPTIPEWNIRGDIGEMKQWSGDKVDIKLPSEISVMGEVLTRAERVASMSCDTLKSLDVNKGTKFGVTDPLKLKTVSGRSCELICELSVTNAPGSRRGEKGCADLCQVQYKILYTTSLSSLGKFIITF